VVFLGSFRQMLGRLKSDHDRFLPHPFQFIFYQIIVSLTLYSLLRSMKRAEWMIRQDHPLS
jgi:hypothetical protein